MLHSGGRVGVLRLEALHERLYGEILGRIKETDLTLPYRNNAYWYYTRTEQGQSYPIYCRKQGSLDAQEQVILDQNALAQGKKFHALGGFDVSPDSPACRRPALLRETEPRSVAPSSGCGKLCS